MKITDYINEKYLDKDVRNFLLNPQHLREILQKSMKDIFVRTKKLLQDKIATYNVSPDTVERTANEIIKCYSDRDIQDMIDPKHWSDKLEHILRDHFFEDFFQQ